MSGEYKPKNIRLKAAKEVFYTLAAELEKVDKFNDKTYLIINNFALLEQMKLDLIADIRKRGVVELFKNGSQEMMRDNKSVDKVMKTIEQQRRLLAELRLTPASEREIVGVVATVEESDEFQKY
ncbi:P27 family phage terminase small subunit [Halalkalibacter oceani]|uniref:P27 family phage terminase small subunit n=1 Tax=Halalkalibacter oceani TaxID=1653776 RepID=UPI003397E834